MLDVDLTGFLLSLGHTPGLVSSRQMDLQNKDESAKITPVYVLKTLRKKARADLSFLS